MGVRKQKGLIVNTTNKNPLILAVGPVPPPLNGTSVSFQVFIDEVQRHSDKVKLDIINSAPPQQKQDPQLLTPANFVKIGQILWQVVKRIRGSDLIFVVGSHQFLFTAGPFCLLVAKIAGKPCYFRSFGFLDVYYKNLSPISQWLFRIVMRNLYGLFVETKLVYEQLVDLIGSNVRWVPGYRKMPESRNSVQIAKKKTEDKLRLAFLGHVREEKGVIVLLESLRTPPINGNGSIHCDIFGLVFQSFAERFKAELNRTPNATYKGVINPEEAVPTLSQYDALVFPTHYQGEGHPGVLMEAMMAGIAVITTNHRSIPELVQDRVNGLLIPPNNVQRLAQAIHLLDSDRKMLADMAKQNWEMRKNYAASNIIPDILQLMDIQI